MSESRIYHVGIVVAELEPAMAELSATTGITWGRRQRVVVDYTTPAGPRTWTVSFVMSREAPYIELLEQMDDSEWAEPGLHHLGVWSEDVDAESRTIEARGCFWEAAMESDTGERLGACYHLLPASGARIELVSRQLSGPRLERYVAGGDYL